MKTLPRILICLILWLGIGVGQTAHAEGTVEKVVLPVGDLKVFAEIFGKVKSDYVEDIPDSQLLKDAIKGMLGGLDPHTVYLDPESYREMNIDTHGEFGGLGLEVTLENSVIKALAAR